MNSQLATLQQFWKQRAPRERAILATGAAVLILALIYSLVFAPIATQRKRLSTDLPLLRTNAARFARDIALVKGGGGSAAPADMGMLVEGAGLAANAHVTSADPKHASLSGKGANWPNVAQLLGDARRQGWSLVRLSVHSPDGGATVDVEAEWTR